MENLILTATFSEPPTLLHLPHNFTNVKTQPGFVLARDAKWLKCVTLFPVTLCTFVLFLYQDFHGKQGWLNLWACFNSQRWYVCPVCPEPHARQILLNKCSPRPLPWGRRGDITAGDTLNVSFWNNDIWKIFQWTTTMPEARTVMKQSLRNGFPKLKPTGLGCFQSAVASVYQEVSNPHQPVPSK